MLEGSHLSLIEFLNDILKINCLKQFEDESAATLIIKVRVKTGSSSEKFEILSSGEVKVHITSLPVEGSANRSIIKLLSKRFSISSSNIDFISGLKSKNKSFRLNYSFTNHKTVAYYISKLKTNFKELY